MYGWCKECKAIAIEGLCSKHGETEPISDINSIEVQPLPEFEKQIINQYLEEEITETELRDKKAVQVYGQNYEKLCDKRKKIINTYFIKGKKLKLGKGIFLVYNDRLYRRRMVCLNKPLVEIKLKKDGLHVKSFAKGEIKGMNKKSLCMVNEKRIHRLTKITKSIAKYQLKNNGEAIISFSGGKDSVVLSHLLKKFNLKNVFIDTTIEFPETHEFINELKENGWDIDIAKAKSNFFTLCKVNDYPAYKNRWCCKTQKFSPFSSYLEENFGDKKVLVFTGIRRWESLSRLEQPLEKPHKHITNQHTGQPILDWLSMDMWVYTWMNKLPVNKIYNYFDRNGCWACPFGLKYRLFLLQYSHPRLHGVLERISNTNIIVEVNNPIREQLIPCSK